jgi:two-component system sensor histidine kinase PilS (NtrC family)
VTLLTGFWAICAAIVLLSGFYQREFFNPELVIPFLGVIGIGTLFYSAVALFFDDIKDKESLWWGLFLVNAVLISALMMRVHWNQSMFFLMYLLNIIASGLSLRARGSYLVGLISVLGYDFSILLGPQEKLVGSLFSLVVNNSALLLVSYLSGQLSSYLENLGLRLDVAHRDLRNMRNLHEQILGQIPSGVLTVDRNGQRVQGNEQAEKILFASNAEQSTLWSDFQRRLLEAQQNAFGQTEFVWSSGDEKKKIIRCQKAALRMEEGSEAADIYVLEDVTVVRELEEVLKNKEKLAAIGALAAGIAHEIRNPLASISGSVQLLSMQAGTDEDKKLFNIVIRETDRLNLLISEFLDYAKPLPKPTDRMSLTALIVEVLELVSYNKKLRSDVQQERIWEGEVFVHGYKDKLKQAFLNIIINAYQAMDKVDAPKLMVRIARDQGQVVLRIRDSGSGMKEETRRRIFEPFFTTKSQGTGLGLAVTHKIFEGHEASIIVESEEGKGTEFVIKMKEAVKLT